MGEFTWFDTEIFITRIPYFFNFLVLYSSLPTLTITKRLKLFSDDNWSWYHSDFFCLKFWQNFAVIDSINEKKKIEILNQLARVRICLFFFFFLSPNLNSCVIRPNRCQTQSILLWVLIIAVRLITTCGINPRKRRSCVV